MVLGGVRGRDDVGGEDDVGVCLREDLSFMLIYAIIGYSEAARRMDFRRGWHTYCCEET